MPIKGLSEDLRFPRLGKIRLGIKERKTVDGKVVEYPKAVDYFVCDRPAFQKVYPGQPHQLDICFPLDDPARFASQFYRAYSRTRGLICKGDGETANRLIDTTTGEQALVSHTAKETARVNVSCLGRECEYYQSRACREMMMLQFLLPTVEGLGIWQLDTSSINSIIGINSGIELMRRAVGHVAMVPVKLSVVPKDVTPNGKTKTVYVLQLDIPMTLGELQGHNMLPEADDEMPEDFFPSAEQDAASEAEESPAQNPVEAPPATAATATEAESTAGAPLVHPATRDQLLNWWQKLWDRGKALGLQMEPLRDRCTEAEIHVAGKVLFKEIEKAETKIAAIEKDRISQADLPF